MIKSSERTSIRHHNPILIEAYHPQIAASWDPINSFPSYLYIQL